MTTSKQINSKKTYVVLGVILVLVVVAIVAFSLNFERSSPAELTGPEKNNNLPQQAKPASITVSDEAEIIQLGERFQMFQKIILDPFILNNGDSQQIVVKPGSDLRDVTAQVKDDAGTYEKRFKTATLNSNKVYYFKWQPEQLSPGQKYPVTLTSYTKSGVKHTFTLSWQAKQNYE